jgi:hypothetical protein
MSAFATLAAEAIHDAVRRRIVAAIIVLCVLSLMGVDGCTSCAGGELRIDSAGASLDELTSLADLAGASGAVLFTMLGMWIVVLAGILASDHLQQTLEDGSANLCLARPVGRGTFALARLAGALGVALSAGAVLLGTATGFLAARSGLPIAPAALAGSYAALGAFVAAALAMTLSLWLPRLATILLVLGGVGTMAVANAVALATGGGGTGTLAWLDRLGPPFASGLVAPLAPWLEPYSLEVDPLLVGLRLLVWCAIAGTGLVLAFRRVELGR